MNLKDQRKVQKDLVQLYHTGNFFEQLLESPYLSAEWKQVLASMITGTTGLKQDLRRGAEQAGYPSAENQEGKEHEYTA